jgi:hypothetical protein
MRAGWLDSHLRASTSNPAFTRSSAISSACEGERRGRDDHPSRRLPQRAEVERA